MTKLVYLTDSYLKTLSTKVLNIFEDAKYGHAVLLQETVFYPQGGGQPTDKGVLRTSESTFQVEFVQAQDNQVHHYGKFITEHKFAVDEQVDCEIDFQVRLMNMKNHSSGHLLGDIVDSMNLGITATKGYHFMDGPYVEYSGTLQGDKQALTNILNQKTQEAIGKKLEYKATICKFEDLDENIGRSISDKLKESKQDIRLVQIEGFLPSPCGGTHISNSNELKRIWIRKIDTGKSKVRFCYNFE